MRRAGASDRGLGPILAVPALAAVWCVLAACPPFLEKAELGLEASIVRLAFQPICHQIPDRSFAAAGAPVAVCARCAGLYAGFLAGACAAALVAIRRRGRPAFYPPRAAILLAALPVASEWGIGHAGLVTSTAMGRAVTASLLGIVAALYAVPAAAELKEEILVRRRSHAEPA